MSALNLKDRFMLRQSSHPVLPDISERLESEAMRSVESFKRPFETKFLQEKRRNITNVKLKCNPHLKSTINLKLQLEPAGSASFRTSLPVEDESILKQPVKTLEFKFLKVSQSLKKRTGRIVNLEKQVEGSHKKVLHAQFSLAAENKGASSTAEDQPVLQREFTDSVHHPVLQPIKPQHFREMQEHVVHSKMSLQNQPVRDSSPDSKQHSQASIPASLGAQSVSISKFLDNNSNRGLKQGTSNVQLFYRHFSIRNDAKPLAACINHNGRNSARKIVPHLNQPQDSAGWLETGSAKKVSFAKNILIYRYTTDKENNLKSAAPKFRF